jgi:Tfp pilus assembly protein FimT
MTSVTGHQANRTARRAAFTLVELILVLALLVVAISLIAPALSRFVQGQALDSEARRLLALAHAGRTRAVTEGVPIRLWLNAKDGLYGLEKVAATQGAVDPDALEFALDDNVQMDPASLQGSDGQPAILFLPDGTVDEDSPKIVQLTDSVGATIEMVQTRNKDGYEIAAANP